MRFTMVQWDKKCVQLGGEMTIHTFSTWVWFRVWANVVIPQWKLFIVSLTAVICYLPFHSKITSFISCRFEFCHVPTFFLLPAVTVIPSRSNTIKPDFMIQYPSVPFLSLNFTRFYLLFWVLYESFALTISHCLCVYTNDGADAWCVESCHPFIMSPHAPVFPFSPGWRRIRMIRYGCGPSYWCVCSDSLWWDIIYRPTSTWPRRVWTRWRRRRDA